MGFLMLVPSAQWYSYLEETTTTVILLFETYLWFLSLVKVEQEPATQCTGSSRQMEITRAKLLLKRDLLLIFVHSHFHRSSCHWIFLETANEEFQWHTYLGPADMTGQLSSVQKSVMVPYSILIWLKKSTAEINKQNVFQSNRRRPNTQSASTHCWQLVAPLHISAVCLCYCSFPEAYRQCCFSIRGRDWQLLFVNLSHTNKHLENNILIAHVARADALHVNSCLRQLPGVWSGLVSV